MLLLRAAVHYQSSSFFNSFATLPPPCHCMKEATDVRSVRTVQKGAKTPNLSADEECGITACCWARKENERRMSEI